MRMMDNSNSQEGTQETASQTEDQEDEEDFFNILEEEHQHWCEVERMLDQMEGARSWAIASKKKKSPGEDVREEVHVSQEGGMVH